MQKPITIKVQRPEPEPEPEPPVFVQKIRRGTTVDDDAEEEEPAETLERHARKRSQEQRAKELAPMVTKTPQRAKDPTPIAVETKEQVEPRAA